MILSFFLAIDLFGRKKDTRFTSNHERKPFFRDNNNRNNDDLDNLFAWEDSTILAGIKLNKDVIDKVRSVDTAFDIDDPNTLKPEQLEKIGRAIFLYINEYLNSRHLLISRIYR